ncbi:MAG: hypothetical protein PHV30_11755 [Candidatus Margulisbacteria bacterium]|nr:hypothetical protein [Candidatus Margulisiibacteriota bacterium]
MEILDLLDELETKILNARHGMFLAKNEAIIDKEEIMDSLDVIRKMINEKYKILKSRLEQDETGSAKQPAFLQQNIESRYEANDEARDIVSQAKKQAQDIKNEIDDYADKVLQNLKLTIAKFKRKLLKLDTIVDVSRDRIQKTAHYAEIEEEEVESDSKD